MNAAPLGSSPQKAADDILSQPESQHGKHIRNAVLNRPSGELQRYLKQAVTELSGWGKATAASFLPEPMPLLEQSVDLQSSLQQRLIEQNPVRITPLFLRVFDVHANKQADDPFVKAKSVTNCALATGVQPSLPYKVELGLEEAPPKQKAQPFVSTAPRRAPQAPSINDTFSLGRTSLGPDLDRSAHKPVVIRTSLHPPTRRRRTTAATRRLSKMRINDEDSIDIEENDLEEENPKRPEGLTEQKWAAQRRKDLRKKDIGKVLSQIKELKRRQEHRAQEKYRPIEESGNDDVVGANDTFYERSKRRQAREEKKREQANLAQRKKQDVLRTRRENKRKRIEKRLKRTKKKGHDDITDDEEEVQVVDSEQEDDQNDQTTLIHEETDQQTDSQGLKRQRIEAHDDANHSNNETRYQSQHDLPRHEVHTGRHEYGYPSHNQEGSHRHSNRPMHTQQQAYHNETYSSHHLNDRQMFDDRGSYDRRAYPPGPNHGQFGQRQPYYESRTPHDFPDDHSRRAPNLPRNAEYHPNVSPQRQFENGGGMHHNRPPPHPMNYPFPANDAPFRPPMPPSHDYRGYPSQHGDSGNRYYHQDRPSRPYPEGDYGPRPYQREGFDGHLRNNANSPPQQHPRAASFRPQSEYYQGESSYRR